MGSCGQGVELAQREVRDCNWKITQEVMTTTGKTTGRRLPKLMGDQSRRMCAKDANYGNAALKVFFTEFLYSFDSSFSLSAYIHSLCCDSV